MFALKFAQNILRKNRNYKISSVNAFHFAKDSTEVTPPPPNTEKKKKTKEQELRDLEKENKESEDSIARFRRLKQRFASTKDLYRVDVGLIIDRPPIFLNFSPLEMENLKYRSYLNKKYKYFPTIPKELLEFKISAGGLSPNFENQMTHKKENSDGTHEYYCENSKVFSEVDPTVMNTKSIQRAGNYKVYMIFKNAETGNWEFPSLHLLENQTFKEARAVLFDAISSGRWQISHYPTEPFVFMQRDFTLKEKEDARNKKLNGVKTFYFAASHLEGIMKINLNTYSDYAWVTKYELNQYFTKEMYFKFIHSLVLY